MTDALRPLNERIDGLERRVDALEQQPRAIEYVGVYVQGRPYWRGQLTTRRGGLWLALADTTDVPGHAPAAWRLIVKEGRAQ